MTVSGIICEYNPMHSGHVFHIQKAKEHSDAVVCCMSGNYVQRGEPAFLNKWIRAVIAVQNGADLVVDMATPWTLSSAQNFASGGVSLLNALGCDLLCFGAETPNLSLFEKIAEASNDETSSKLIPSFAKQGMSYPAAFFAAMEKRFGSEAGSFLLGANNLLGVEYVKAIMQQGSSMIPIPIKRQGNVHGSEMTSGKFISAQAIRTADNLNNVAHYLAPGTFQAIQNAENAREFPAKLSTAETAILYALRRQSKEKLKLYCGSEHIANRIKKALNYSAGFDELIKNAKNKSVTQTQLMRCIMRAFLGITDDMSKRLPPYIHPLATNEKGLEILKQTKQIGTLPIASTHAELSRLGGFAAEIYKKEIEATALYGCFTPKFNFQTKEQTHSIRIIK